MNEVSDNMLRQLFDMYYNKLDELNNIPSDDLPFFWFRLGFIKGHQFKEFITNEEKKGHGK